MFLSLFGEPPKDGAGAHDFTALDLLLPHPPYGWMYRVCMLNPGDATFQSLRPLWAGAHEPSGKRHGST